MLTKKTRSLVLHIGDPKTGTSSIQRTLQLGLVKGISSEISGFMDQVNSANAIGFARIFTPKGARGRAAHEVERWIKKENAGTLIVSSEFFSEADPELVKRHLDHEYPDLSGRIRVIGYVRPHVSRALSAFTERTKAGYTLYDFDKWLGHFLRAGSLYYAPRFMRWHAAFGESFILRPYIRNHLRDRDVVTDFFSEALGVGNFSLSGNMNENQKISLKALSGLRGFNRGMSEAGVVVKQRIQMSLMISKFIETDPEAKMPKMGSENIARIIRACRKDAQDLDREFFGEPLFLQELAKSRKDAVENALDLSMELHFTPAEQGMLDIAVNSLTALLPKSYKNWSAYYRQFNASHNVGKLAQTTKGGEIQKRLQDLAVLFS